MDEGFLGRVRSGAITYYNNCQSGSSLKLAQAPMDGASAERERVKAQRADADDAGLAVLSLSGIHRVD